MRKITFTLLMVAIFGLAAFAQDTESYTALKVSGENVPVIDGTIDAIWGNVTMAPLEKVPESSPGTVHANITVPDPDATDFYAEFGMLWDATGMFFVFKVVDDIIVMDDDYYPDNGVDADQWWTDDHVNLLFSKNLGNETFNQWEFAYQYNVDQEEKLSSDLWANPAVISEDLVETAWDDSQNGEDTYLLETFISWDAFDDGNFIASEGATIYGEARARDDDDDGAWESMFQWSTVNYGVESDGTGMGEITLSATEVEAVAVALNKANERKMEVYPNPAKDMAELKIMLDIPGNVKISFFDMSGKQLSQSVYSSRAAGKNILPLNTYELPQGIYFINVETNSNSDILKFVKR